ncbi:helix-turn-helix transcriptional regulator [Chitinophaga sp. CC14]|uniref:helix-turn-helix domain-containing protein n=1 Tax=Chitinophaga sp. CC14 TaxID=3029199 RepID=UPI003B81ED1B
MKLGKAIVKLRELHGLKQVELADKAGISATALSQIETDKAKPSDKTLKDIAAVFNKDAAFIILLSIDPEKDMNEEDGAMFKHLFPGFHDKLLSTIG